MKIRVYILTRSQTLNPADETIKKALHQVGHTNITGFRLGRFLEIDVDETLSASKRRGQIDAACKSTIANLANPITEVWEIEVAP